MIYESMSLERMVIPCLNNKVLLLNMQNINEIILLNEACDDPRFTNWDSSVNCGEIPLVVYEVMYDYDIHDGRYISTDILSRQFQASLKEYINQQKWNDDDISTMLYENIVYHKDGYIERTNIDFDRKETISSEVSRILDFGDEVPASKMLYYTTDDGVEIILNMQNVSLLAMPLLKVEDAICTFLEELMD